MVSPETHLRSAAAGAGWEAVRSGALWLAVEFVVRWGAVTLAASLTAGPGGAVRLAGPVWTTSVTSMLAANVLLVWLFARRARARGLGRETLGYVGAAAGRRGLLGAVGMLGLFGVTVVLDHWLMGLRGEPELVEAVARGGVGLAVLYTLTNGATVPAAEEFAWRGYIQAHAIAAWGTPVGLAVTALAFAAKHMVVDESLERAFTLVAGSLALGLIRLRWGTVASTVAHAIGNTAVTLLLLWAAFE